MKSILLILSLIFISCNNPSESSDESTNLANRKNKLTLRDVAGTWKGSSEQDGIMLSEKIIIKADGTFLETAYSGINNSGGTEYSKTNGKVELIVREAIDKDNYGEIINKRFLHYIEFKMNTQYGLRTSRYVFESSNRISPSGTFFASDVSLEKNNEN